MDKKRLIRISKDKVFLTSEMSLNLSQTSLIGKNLSFRSIQDIYFEVEIIEYDKVSNKLSVEVVNYQPENIENFKQQTAKAPVSFVYFRPLKWSQIQRHLGSYTKGILLKEGIIIEDIPTSNENESKKSTIKRTEYPINTSENYNQFLQAVVELNKSGPVIEKVIEEAKVYFIDADFNSGYITFPYKSKKLNETFNLKIENTFLLSEFNAVKSYFPKALGGKKHFSIKVVFTLTNHVVTEITTTSLEISGINENIIDSIKLERVLNLTSIPLKKIVDKSLFTAEDIFDSFDENLNDGNIFKQSGDDILDLLIAKKNIRNAKHLHFLSGAKHSAKQKLRFTLNPLFGFLFFIEGETKNHFCWELLDSHATYLWSLNKKGADVTVQFKRIEMNINVIRDIGRAAYKKDFNSKKADNDLDFFTIEHSNINSANKESFIDWQHRLNERLS